MRLLFISILILPAHIAVFAQSKRSDIWYFGYNAGLDFSTKTPVVLFDNKMIAVNTSSVMCDEEGNLLFYTDGIRVWNKNHELKAMLDGFDSNYSQQVISIPKPNAKDIYYIFHITDDNYPEYIHRIDYSVVNVSTGDLIFEEKNVRLPTDDIMMKISAIEQPDGEGFWIVTQGTEGGKFYTFHLTDQGVNTTPIITTVIPASTGLYEYGQIKFSIDGKMMAVTNELSDRITLFQFDLKTGKLDNYIHIATDNPISLEFSPDGTLLYSTSQYDIGRCGPSQLYQYSLKNYNATSIQKSAVKIITADDLGMLQTAPDGKIYCGRRNPDGCNWHDYLSVIELPNKPGAECFFRLDKLHLGGKGMWQGLPNFPPSNLDVCYGVSLPKNFSDQLKDTIVCSNNYTIDLSSSDQTSYQWQDGNSEPTYTINTTGIYSLTIKKGQCIKNYGFNVTLEKGDPIEIAYDTAYLFSRPIQISLSIKPDQIIWQDLKQTLPYVITQPGEYSFVAELGHCIYKDTVVVFQHSINIPNVITPNNDKSNDYFEIEGISPNEQWELTIFNRYGKKIFHSLRYKNDWQWEESGVYYYEFKNSKFNTDFKGWLHVIGSATK